jgi:hypothetical protein
MSRTAASAPSQASPTETPPLPRLTSSTPACPVTGSGGAQKSCQYAEPLPVAWHAPLRWKCPPRLPHPAPARLRPVARAAPAQQPLRRHVPCRWHRALGPLCTAAASCPTGQALQVRLSWHLPPTGIQRDTNLPEAAAALYNQWPSLALALMAVAKLTIIIGRPQAGNSPAGKSITRAAGLPGFGKGSSSAINSIFTYSCATYVLATPQPAALAQAPRVDAEAHDYCMFMHGFICTWPCGEESAQMMQNQVCSLTSDDPDRAAWGRSRAARGVVTPTGSSVEPRPRRDRGAISVAACVAWHCTSSLGQRAKNLHYVAACTARLTRLEARRGNRVSLTCYSSTDTLNPKMYKQCFVK